jgi:hypothetical protein
MVGQRRLPNEGNAVLRGGAAAYTDDDGANTADPIPVKDASRENTPFNKNMYNGYDR